MIAENWKVEAASGIKWMNSFGCRKLDFPERLGLVKRRWSKIISSVFEDTQLRVFLSRIFFKKVVGQDDQLGQLSRLFTDVAVHTSIVQHDAQLI